MPSSTHTNIIQNKRVYHEYYIEKKIESGIALLGWEVKSARSKMITIDNSYISFYNKEAYIYNSLFQFNTTQFSNITHNVTRLRKLLLKKKELLFLMEKINHQKYTIVILELYWKNSWIKANIGLAKGKKKYDKRNTINIRKWQYEKKQIAKYT